MDRKRSVFGVDVAPDPDSFEERRARWLATWNRRVARDRAAPIPWTGDDDPGRLPSGGRRLRKGLIDPGQFGPGE